jgi:hypothetical protein
LSSLFLLCLFGVVSGGQVVCCGGGEEARWQLWLFFFSGIFFLPLSLPVLPRFFEGFPFSVFFLWLKVVAMGRNSNGGVTAPWLWRPVLLFSFFFTVLQQGEEDGSRR